MYTTISNVSQQNDKKEKIEQEMEECLRLEIAAQKSSWRIMLKWIVRRKRCYQSYRI